MVHVRWRRGVDDDDEASDDLQPEMAMAGSHLVSTEGPLVCTCALEISFKGASFDLLRDYSLLTHVRRGGRDSSRHRFSSQSA